MRVRGLAAMLAVTVALVALPVTPVWAADEFLVTSDPAPRDELDDVPGWVTLVFATDADANLARIVVQNSAGLDVTTGPLIVEGTNVSVQLMNGLGQDTFTVTYRTSDEAKDPRGGAFQFSYGPGTWTDVDDTWLGEDEEPDVIRTPPPPAPDVPDTPAPTVQSTEGEEAEPSETTDPSGSAPASGSAEPPAPTPAASEAAEPAEPGGSGVAPWMFGVGGALLVAAGGAYLLDRRRGGKGRHSAGQ